MNGSIAFDRAAEYYDATRALTPEGETGVVAVLEPELRGRGPCLEIGIGTGRIAVPLLHAGVDLVGVDLSLPMLRRLIGKLEDRGGLPVVQGDAIRLPFGGRSVGAALACHVLHLIPAWRDVVRELARVLRPGGLFLIDPGGGPGGEWREIVRHVAEEAGIRRPRPGLADIRQLDAFMQELGAAARSLDPVPITRRQPLGDALVELERQIHSWTWDIPADAMRTAVAATRKWAESRFGDLDQPRDVEAVINWRAYEFA